MTCRQLTSDEAHVLDHFVDAVWSQDRVRIAEEAPRAVAVFGGDFDKLKMYVGSKLVLLETKPVEKYHDGMELFAARGHIRLPFDADHKLVAEQGMNVYYEYLRHATYPRFDTPEDPSFGRAGEEAQEVRLKGLAARRRKHESGED